MKIANESIDLNYVEERLSFKMVKFAAYKRIWAIQTNFRLAVSCTRKIWRKHFPTRCKNQLHISKMDRWTAVFLLYIINLNFPLALWDCCAHSSRPKNGDSQRFTSSDSLLGGWNTGAVLFFCFSSTSCTEPSRLAISKKNKAKNVGTHWAQEEEKRAATKPWEMPKYTHTS